MVPNMIVLSIGRFIYGFAAGIYAVGGPKIMFETIPQHLIDKGFGSTTNISVNIFTMVSMLLGIGMPTVLADVKTTGYWRVVYGVPIIFILLDLLMFMTVHPYDSLEFHIKRGEKESAMKII